MSEMDKKIDNFCKDWAKVWKQYAPYWRFGEFANCILGGLQLEGKDWYEASDEKVMGWIKEYFENHYPPY